MHLVTCYIYVYIFRFKSYLLTRVARIENARRCSMYMVVNEFASGVSDMVCKCFSNAKSEFLNRRDGGGWGEV